MSDIVSRRQRTPWFWPDLVYYLFGEGQEHNKTLSVLHSFTYKVSHWASCWKEKKKTRCCSASAIVNTNLISPQVIRERAENISSTESESDSDSGTKKRQAFLDMLLKTVDEEGNRMSHQDIQEEVDTFMFRVGA